jgi:hypothetical protein
MANNNNNNSRSPRESTTAAESPDMLETLALYIAAFDHAQYLECEILGEMKKRDLRIRAEINCKFVYFSFKYRF